MNEKYNSIGVEESTFVEQTDGVTSIKSELENIQCNINEQKGILNSLENSINQICGFNLESPIKMIEETKSESIIEYLESINHQHRTILNRLADLEKRLHHTLG